MKKNIIIVLLAIIIAVLARFGYSYYNNYKSEQSMKNRKSPEVTVDTVKDADIIRSFEAPGRVTSKYRVDVVARINGYLQKSYFKEGDFVNAGQTLFLIEPAEYSNASSVAKADVANLKAQLTYAEKQLARAKDLVEKDYIAKSQYDNLLSQRDSLKAQLASAEAKYSDSNRNLSYTNVKAPVKGRVGIINVTLGNFVSQLGAPLTTIYSMDPMYVTFPLDASDYNALENADGTLKQTRKVEIYFPDGQKYAFDGVQDFHDNKIDESTGTVTMRGTFKNPDNQLLHGEYVNVKLYSNKPVKTPIVPLVAVQENQAGKYVFTIDDKNLPQITYIKVNGQHGDNWIIKEGLKSGDKVIIEGIQKVRPNMPVTIKTVN